MSDVDIGGTGGSSPSTGTHHYDIPAVDPTTGISVDTLAGSSYINGVNSAFLLPDPTVDVTTIRVYKDGMRMKETKGGVSRDYTVIPSPPLGVLIVFSTGNIPQTGSNLVFDYNTP